ncbi:DNA adenine methylase [Akkermansiaceae bacterium]|nr:DNA adenine methylase [Akkermansiaceae bacterium]MDB4508404.1 DNA adenine methylase [Akkermansiaceae bacterium]
MGSKTKLIDSLVATISEVHTGQGICDLFAGSCTLSGALGHEAEIYSNDIQVYSGVLAETYLNSFQRNNLTGEKLIQQAESHYKTLKAELTVYVEVSEYDTPSLSDFISSEEKSRLLLTQEFKADHHLFTKNYAGTWWSIEQSLWIDSLRKVYQENSTLSEAPLILSSLMYAMAYCSQGTGHYAQYRDAKNESSLKDILIYRRRSLPDYFIRKFNKSLENIPSKPTSLNHQITSLDYRERLDTLPESTVYADPPYCFVHYSRFYHALETLVLYDYPEIQQRNGTHVKGRYREERHQSPFSIRTQVPTAFEELFQGVKTSKSNLVLSYANTGMISLDELLSLAKKSLQGYQLDSQEIDYRHKTMGRKNDHDRQVKECFITAKR